MSQLTKTALSPLMNTINGLAVQEDNIKYSVEDALSKLSKLFPKKVFAQISKVEFDKICQENEGKPKSKFNAYDAESGKCLRNKLPESNHEFGVLKINTVIKACRFNTVERTTCDFSNIFYFKPVK